MLSPTSYQDLITRSPAHMNHRSTLSIILVNPRYSHEGHGWLWFQLQPYSCT